MDLQQQHIHYVIDIQLTPIGNLGGTPRPPLGQDPFCFVGKEGCHL
jgi:hypothetical protein